MIWFQGCQSGKRSLMAATELCSAVSIHSHDHLPHHYSRSSAECFAFFFILRQSEMFCQAKKKVWLQDVEQSIACDSCYKSYIVSDIISYLLLLYHQHLQEVHHLQPKIFVRTTGNIFRNVGKSSN